VAVRKVPGRDMPCILLLLTTEELRKYEDRKIFNLDMFG
jgi:hypothetical protein